MKNNNNKIENKKQKKNSKNKRMNSTALGCKQNGQVLHKTQMSLKNFNKKRKYMKFWNIVG